MMFLFMGIRLRLGILGPRRATVVPVAERLGLGRIPGFTGRGAGCLSGSWKRPDLPSSGSRPGEMVFGRKGLPAVGMRGGFTTTVPLSNTAVATSVGLLIITSSKVPCAVV